MISPKSLQYVGQGKGQRPNGAKLGETRENHLRNVCELVSNARRKSYAIQGSKVPRVSPRNPLPKGPIASYTRKDMENRR